MDEREHPARGAVTCLLLPRGVEQWLVPASLVVEVVTHSLEVPVDHWRLWRGMRLAVSPLPQMVAGEASAIMRRLHGGRPAWYALTLSEAPSARRLGANALKATETDGVVLLQGQRVRLIDTAGLEASLPGG